MADFSLWLEFIDQVDMIFIFLKNYNILSKNERNLYFCNNDMLELANGVTWNRHSNPPCSKMGQLMFESICLLSYHRSTHYRWARCPRGYVPPPLTSISEPNKHIKFQTSGILLFIVFRNYTDQKFYVFYWNLKVPLWTIRKKTTVNVKTLDYRRNPGSAAKVLYNKKKHPYKWPAIECNSINTGTFEIILWSNSRLQMWYTSKD